MEAGKCGVGFERDDGVGLSVVLDSCLRDSNLRFSEGIILKPRRQTENNLAGWMEMKRRTFSFLRFLYPMRGWSDVE